MKLPGISFSRSQVSPPGENHVVYMCQAVRQWDVPSNGVFMLFIGTEIDYPTPYHQRIDWRGLLADKLAARERRLQDEYGRHWKDFMCEYSTDETWCAIDGNIPSAAI